MITSTIGKYKHEIGNIVWYLNQNFCNLKRSKKSILIEEYTLVTRLYFITFNKNGKCFEITQQLFISKLFLNNQSIITYLYTSMYVRENDNIMISFSIATSFLTLVYFVIR